MQGPGDFVGVDLGTSSCKVAVVDARGGIRATAARRYPLELGGSGAAEQDPEEWWKAVSEALREVLAAGKFGVEGVGFTGQGSGSVPTGPGGAPLRKAKKTMDPRGK